MQLNLAVMPKLQSVLLSEAYSMIHGFKLYKQCVECCHNKYNDVENSKSNTTTTIAKYFQIERKLFTIFFMKKMLFFFCFDFCRGSVGGIF